MIDEKAFAIAPWYKTRKWPARRRRRRLRNPSLLSTWSTVLQVSIGMRIILAMPTIIAPINVVRPGPQSLVAWKLAKNDSTPSFVAVLTNRESGA